MNTVLHSPFELVSVYTRGERLSIALCLEERESRTKVAGN